jgi:hypothetical protein
VSEFRVGQRVRLVGKHPWAGHEGEVIRFEHLAGLHGLHPRVRLENGQEAYITERGQARLVGADEPVAEPGSRIGEFVKQVRRLTSRRRAR